MRWIGTRELEKLFFETRPVAPAIGSFHDHRGAGLQRPREQLLYDAALQIESYPFCLSSVVYDLLENDTGHSSKPNSPSFIAMCMVCALET